MPVNKRLSMTVNAEQDKWLEEKSKETGLAYAAIVRLLIARAIANNQKLI